MSCGEALRLDSHTVAIGVLLSLAGAFVGLTTFSIARHVGEAHKVHGRLFVCLSGIALGGSSIWCTQLLGFDALVLDTCDGDVSHPCHVHAPAAWLSLIVVCCGATCAMFLVAHATDDARASATLLLPPTTPAAPATSRWRAGVKYATYASASCILGASICAAFFLSARGLSCGSRTGEPSWWVVLFALLVACIASAAGLALVLLSTQRQHLYVLGYRSAASLCIALAINGMFFLGLTAIGLIGVRGAPAAGDDTEHDNPMMWHEVVIWSLGLNLVQLVICQRGGSLLEQTQRKLDEASRLRSSHEERCAKLLEAQSSFDFPMVVIRATKLRALGRFESHECLRDRSELIFLDSAAQALQFGVAHPIVFISHQWLSAGHPDPDGVQFRLMLAALLKLADKLNVRESDMFVWIDFSSIPQVNKHMQQAAIDSLQVYSAISYALIIIAPVATHASGAVCDVDTYSRRGWTRGEVFAKMISGLGDRLYLADDSLLEEGGKLVALRMSHADLAEMSTSHLAASSSRRAPRPVSTDDERDRKRQAMLREMLFIYQGDFTCCETGHVGAKGEGECTCDKQRLVSMCLRMYGHVLINKGHPLRDFLLRHQQELWPESHFGGGLLESMEEVAGAHSQSLQASLPAPSLTDAISLAQSPPSPAPRRKHTHSVSRIFPSALTQTEGASSLFAWAGASLSTLGAGFRPRLGTEHEPPVHCMSPTQSYSRSAMECGASSPCACPSRCSLAPTEGELEASQTASGTGSRRWRSMATVPVTPCTAESFTASPSTLRRHVPTLATLVGTDETEEGTS